MLGEAPDGMRVVVARPRLIWGAGDTSVMPNFIAIVEQGQYRWVGDGHYPTSTCHVRNVCEGLLLAADRGAHGEVYFLTDGPPVDFRDFMTAMLETQGVDPGARSMPRSIARVGGWLAEALWRMLPLRGRPPVTRSALRLVGEQVTVSDAKARAELGYRAKVSMADGLEEMRRMRMGTLVEEI